jgi:hypothetical protein
MAEHLVRGPATFLVVVRMRVPVALDGSSP